jgi:hypothetical protein
MKKIILLISIVGMAQCLLLNPAKCQTQLLAGFETDLVTSPTQVNLQPDVQATGIQCGPLQRGPGLTASGTAANTFSAANFVQTSYEDAVSTGSYFEFQLEAAAGYFFTPKDIAWHFRRSGTGPLNFQWVYSVDGGATLNPISPPFIYDGTQTNGLAFGPISMPQSPMISNLVSGTTVLFRLYAWGASGATGVGAFGRLAGPDLAVYGEVTAFGTPTAIIQGISPSVLCGSAANVGTFQVDIVIFNGAASIGFDMLLSDLLGDFSNSTLIAQGTLPGHSGLHGISANLPAGLPTGSGYRIQIVPASGVGSISAPFNMVLGVANPSQIAANPANSALEVTWEQLPGCWEESFVVIGESPITSLPTGDGSLWQANANYTASNNFFNEGQVVYKGTDNQVLITGLTNGDTYHISVFNRLQTNWTSGVAISAVPAAPISGWQVQALETRYVITFDDPILGVVAGPLSGTGMSPNPQIGQLDSRAWRINGMSDQPQTQFEEIYELGDFARGTSQGGISTGGLWAFEVASGNMALGVQPITNDFNPGSITLRVENKTGQMIDAIQIGYTFYEFNDQDRSSSWNVAFSLDDVAYTPVNELNVSSVEARVTPTQWQSSLLVGQISSLALQPDAVMYLQWQSSDAGGGGSRDELAIDDIQLIAYGMSSSNPNAIEVSGNARQVRVAADAFAQIPIGTYLAVDEELVVFGTLEVEVSAHGYANLLFDQASGNGKLRLGTYLEGSTQPQNGRWFHLSFPDAVPYASIREGQSLFNLTDVTQSPILVWDAAVGDWVLPPGGPSGNFEPGRGYLIFAGENTTGTYTMSLPGKMAIEADPINPASVSTSLGYTAAPAFNQINGSIQAGWNLIGNPYSTTYDLFQQQTPIGMAGFAVRRNATNTGFETYVFTEEFASGRHIAPFQAFWVRTTQSAPASFVFQPSQRQVAQTPIRTKKALESYVVAVQNSAGHRDETRIYFREEATDGFDLLFDGDKLPNDAGFPNLFTRAEIPLAVNSLPVREGIQKIPLGFQCDASGHFELLLSKSEPTLPLFLKDLKTGHVHPISEKSYGFLHTPQDPEMRFELYFGATIAQMIPDGSFVAWFDGDRLKVRSTKAIPSAKLRIQDALGRRVWDGDLNFEGRVATLPTALPKGVYVLTFIEQDGQVETLKILKGI